MLLVLSLLLSLLQPLLQVVDGLGVAADISAAQPYTTNPPLGRRDGFNHSLGGWQNQMPP